MAKGDPGHARRHVSLARARLDERAAAIVDPRLRASFLERVVHHAALVALADELESAMDAP